MRDPNDIALQSVDPDLSSQGDDLTDGGAGDLMDYAASVGQWGADSTETLLADVSGGALALAPLRRPCGPRPQSIFHASTRITTPFTVAAVVAVLILVIVLIPSGGSN